MEISRNSLTIGREARDARDRLASSQRHQPRQLSGMSEKLMLRGTPSVEKGRSLPSARAELLDFEPPRRNDHEHGRRGEAIGRDDSRRPFATSGHARDLGWLTPGTRPGSLSPVARGLRLQAVRRALLGLMLRFLPVHLLLIVVALVTAVRHTSHLLSPLLRSSPALR